MVEILVLGPFCDFIYRLAESRGCRGSYYRRVALAFWCLGELTGLFVGLTVSPPTEAISLLVIYACALAGAGFGAALVYALTRSRRGPYGQRPDRFSNHWEMMGRIGGLSGSGR